MEVMNPLEENIVVFKNMQAGVITKLSEESKVNNLNEEVPPGQNDLKDHFRDSWKEY